MVLMFGLRVTSLKGRPLTPMMALTSPLVLPHSSSMLVTPLVMICTLAGKQRIVVGAAAHDRQPGGLEIGHAGVLGVLLDQLVMLHQQHRGEQQPRLLGDLDLAHLGSCRGGGEREREGNDQPLPANHGRPPRTTACGAAAQRQNGIGTAAAQAPLRPRPRRGRNSHARIARSGRRRLSGRMKTRRHARGRRGRSEDLCEANRGAPVGKLAGLPDALPPEHPR